MSVFSDTALQLTSRPGARPRPPPFFIYQKNKICKNKICVVSHNKPPTHLEKKALVPRVRATAPAASLLYGPSRFHLRVASNEGSRSGGTHISPIVQFRILRLKSIPTLLRQASKHSEALLAAVALHTSRDFCYYFRYSSPAMPPPPPASYSLVCFVRTCLAARLAAEAVGPEVGGRQQRTVSRCQDGGVGEVQR
jgi:hypothetical protein